MIDTIGAVNKVDKSYKAMITGIENDCGGDDYYSCKLEFWIEETMEVVWKLFSFSVNMFKPGYNCKEIEGHPDWLDDSGSHEFCRVLGLDTDYMSNRVIYGKENIVGGYHYPIKELDEELFIGKELGIVIGKGYGLHSIGSFISLSELLTMPVPD